MALNTGKLAGRTAFITGASRGIGKAIALKLAKDGANVVVAAKTSDPHPKLPGTIHATAQEIEAAGGRALPCIVDLQDDNSVIKSVELAVKTFGGIDILVNNASATILTGTLNTPMKTYDLLNDTNARGTYLCSQVCLPYLKKGTNPHILNISPPLNMKPIWFRPHVAYSMSKYGMSMCVLGMSEELKADGIAVNALWPRTTIATATVNMLGGDKMMKRSRKPEIMADAAYVLLTRDSRVHTGRFAVDDDVLREVGVTDLRHYSVVEGADLRLDFFLDGAESSFATPSTAKQAKSSGAAGVSANVASVEAVLKQIESLTNEDLVKKIGGVFRFDLSGGNPGVYILDLKNGKGSVVRNPPPNTESQVTLSLSSEDFVSMFKGQLDSTQAFMSGKLKIKGDMGKALKLDGLMQLMKSKL